MHSHSNTLLSKMGFADPDRNNSLHDAACRYLLQKRVAERLFFQIEPTVPFPEEWIGRYTYTRPGVSPIHDKFLVKKKSEGCTIATKSEVLISKGEGKYRSTVGFMDVLISRSHESQYSGYEVKTHTANLFTYIDKHGCPAKSAEGTVKQIVPSITTRSRSVQRSLAIEVKAKKSSVTDAIRQIKLYQEHYQEGNFPIGVKWLLVTLFDLSKSESDQVKSEGIRVVKLGADFQRFLETEKNQATDTEVFQ